MKALSKDTCTKILRSSYLGAIALMTLLIIVIIFTRHNEETHDTSKAYVSIENEWSLTPEGSDYINIDKLESYFPAGSDALSLYWKIPDTSLDQALIFRSKDVYCNVFINDSLIYSTNYYESPFYTASPGHNWNFVTIPSEYSGQNVELQIKYVYGLDAVTADHFIWGSKADWVIDFLSGKILAIFLSVFIIFIGIVIMFMDRSSFENSGKHSLLYLGIYAVLMGLWSLIETNTLQIIVNDGRLIQLADNFLMVTDTLPLFFYLDAEFDILRHRVLRLITLADIIYIFVCIIGQLTGLTDIHNLLTGSWIATGLSFIILVGILAKQIYLFTHGEEIKKSIVIQIIGFVSLMVIVVICIPIFVRSDGVDRAETIRFGMLVMVIMFAIAGQIKTYELIMQGTRYDIVKNLAYQDALTGLANRTSYLETLESYRENPPASLGVIFFDVNNLKLANDNYGHDIGDQLICSAAELISQSFKQAGIAYRTGGDEFLVFIDKDNPEECYKNCLELFNKSIAALNKTKKYDFKIEIAHGFALRKGATEEDLRLMIQAADELMYENKKKLKEKN